jgi:small terminase subunit
VPVSLKRWEGRVRGIFNRGGESIVAKGKYQRWLESDGLLLLEGWARDGLTDEQLAEKMGCGVRTLYDWKERFPQISQALKKGKEVVDYQVENALLVAALDGNTTAQIFWLKNRRPDKWRDKPPEQVAGGSGAEDDPITKSLKEEAENGLL